MNKVPEHLQSYDYEPPIKKRNKLQKAYDEYKKTNENKEKKSQNITKKREKEKKIMKTLTTPGYNKNKKKA